MITSLRRINEVEVDPSDQVAASNLSFGTIVLVSVGLAALIALVSAFDKRK